MAGMIRLLVVDDHLIVREGLCAMLEMREGLIIVGKAADGEEAVEQALALRPDVILMDLQMPRKNGISAIHDIIDQWPDARILVLSSFSEEVQIVESMRAGALGYLLKTARPDELIEGIRRVYAGEMPLDPQVARQLVVTLAPSRAELRLSEELTPRELEILPLVARGCTNQEIADQLGIAPRTVGTHVSNMIHKGGVENRVQLSVLALRQGITSLYGEK